MTDMRHLPIVVMQWHGEVDPELLATFGRWMDELLDQLEAEGLCVATLADVRRSAPLSAAARRTLVEMRSNHQRHSRGRVIVDVIVSDRPELRGLVRALSWIDPHAPAAALAAVDEGLQRCRAALQRAGITSPSVGAADFEPPAEAGS